LKRGDQIVVCFEGGIEVEVFDDKEEATSFLKERIETLASVPEMGVFVNGAPFKINLRIGFGKGVASCAECRCCLGEKEKDE
jgi:hypothetical protein